MGQLKIVPGGIQLTGQAVVMDMLRASTIRSRHGQPISIGKFLLKKNLFSYLLCKYNNKHGNKHLICEN